ncbi:glycosyltransferase family 2 protein [Clostridiaceae bacterium AM27-36LB]|jgi:rhamnosyltransferase|nr:glycosyltransferase family 2 protein [Clostridiales bacterium AM23-16LB]RHT84208.1 glycosyltransferase family 2 protein [Clostridiaceae bacterium AM27-36LB]
MEVDVLIPVYRPDGKLTELLKRLKTQNYPIHRVILMNTEEKHFPTELTGIWDRVEVYHLAKEEFDHGGTRDRGVRMSTADLVVCMTQDAMPADETLIEELVKPFDDPGVWAAYARQLPNEDCREVEKYTRSFNYPEQSMVKTKEDLDRLGIKTFFCSNVCAAWRREKYLELGGFVKHTIFNEDMILAGTMIKQGGKIAYCAKAKVIHSHNYSAFQQFHRNFDLAVSQTMYPEVFGGIRSESEGVKLVKKSLSYCIKIGKPWLMIQVVTQSAGKFLGYKMGQQYRSLPMWLILRCTMSPSFWRGGKA